MASIEYVNFDLFIERTRGAYKVRVVSPTIAEEYSFVLPATNEGVELIRSEIEKAVLRRSIKAPARRAVMTEQVKQLSEFGGKLFDSLVIDKVREEYEQSRRQTKKENKGVRLTLHVPQELERVPWEFLYDQKEGDFIGLSRYAPIVRYLAPKFEQPLFKVNPPLRLLVVIADPESERLDPLNVEREKRLVSEAVKELQKNGLVTLKIISGHDTARQLAEALREEWHIVHFACHGGFDDRTKEGVLIFESDSGKEKQVGSSNLNMLVQDATATRLIVLNACDTTWSAAGDPFSSVAGGLVSAGVPAVVAMQFEISDVAAIEMARAFYSSLTDNLPVDAALAEGRKAVKLKDPESLEWGTPVLYMSVSDGRLFEITGAGSPQPEAVTGKPPRSQEDLADLYLRGREYFGAGRWREALETFLRVEEIQPGFKDVDALVAKTKTELDKQKAAEERRAHVNAVLASAQEADAKEDWTGSMEQYRMVLTLDPLNVEAKARLESAQRQQTLALLYAEGREYWKLKQWQEAVDSLRRLRELKSDYKDVNDLLRTAQTELGQQETEAQRRTKINALMDQAQTAESREDWDSATKRWQAILDLVPSHQGAGEGLKRGQRMQVLAKLYASGVQNLNARRWREALDGFRQLKATQSDYKDVQALYAKAEWELARQGEDEQKMAQVDDLYTLAQTATLKEDWQTAIAKFEAILALDPSQTDAGTKLAQANRNLELRNIYERGRQYYDAGRWEEALGELRRVKRLQSKYKDVDVLITNTERAITRERTAAPSTGKKGGGAGRVIMILLAAFVVTAVLCVLVAQLSRNNRPSEPISQPVFVPPTAVAARATRAPEQPTQIPRPTARGVQQSNQSAQPTLPIRNVAPTQKLTEQDVINLAGAWQAANQAEISAQSTLDPTPLYYYFAGNQLGAELQYVQSLGAERVVRFNRLENVQLLSGPTVSPDGTVSVRQVETWSGEVRSLDTGACLARYPRHDTPQTIHYQRSNANAYGWIIYLIDFEDQTEPAETAC